MASKKPSPSPVSKLFAQALETQKELTEDYKNAPNAKNPSRGQKTAGGVKPSGKKPLGAASGKAPQKPKPKPSNNIRDEKEKREFFDSEEVLKEKLNTLSEWVKSSQHCILFTGAGVSTSTGIPDFRSGMNTVLPTGPGVWELRAKGETRKGNAVKSTLSAVPSQAHMAIVKLHEEGLVKFTVSQNVDGLHRRSGLHPDQLAELHGNTNLEKCLKCGAKYMRDFRTRTSKAVHDHKTGRLCDDPKCRGALVDSIINFNEDLPEDEMNKGFSNGRKADLCIVLGSSLRVTPAADIPEEIIKRGSKVVICNLQKTPLNNSCAMELHATTDAVMCGLMERLGLDIPLFTLKRRFSIQVSPTQVLLQGMDLEKDNPYSFLRSVHIGVPKELGTSAKLVQEPFCIKFHKKVALSPEKPLVVSVTLAFQGHYGEPDFSLQYEVDSFGNVVYFLEYDLSNQHWNLCKQ